MAFRRYIFALLVANVLFPIAIVIFGKGFFPYKPFLSGLAEYEKGSWGPPPEGPFNKVVFMVVDALRRLVTVQAIHGKLLIIAVILSTPSLLGLVSLKGALNSCTFAYQIANTSQPHFRWLSNSLHGTCHLSNNNYAKNQGHYYRIYPHLP